MQKEDSEKRLSITSQATNEMQKTLPNEYAAAGNIAPAQIKVSALNNKSSRLATPLLAHSKTLNTNRSSAVKGGKGGLKKQNSGAKTLSSQTEEQSSTNGPRPSSSNMDRRPTYVQKAFKEVSGDQQLKPGLMKGPNAALLCVDELHHRIKTYAWNNIPLPLVDAFEEIIKVFKEFKQLHFQTFNDTIMTQRVVNLNQQQARTDITQLRTETINNFLLAEDERQKALAQQEVNSKALLAQAESDIEERLTGVIDQRIKEETVLLRQWATNLVREKVTEDSRILKNWTLKEIKDTREMFNVAGMIGQPAMASSDDEGSVTHSQASPSKIPPIYRDFGEFVSSVINKHKENTESHENKDSLISQLKEQCRELELICAEKQTMKEAAQIEREIRQRIDEKVQELQETQRREQKDISNKLTLLKNEVNLSLIDKDTQQFLKGVKKDWNHLLSRSKTNENLVKDLQENQEGILKTMNTMKLNINSSSDLGLNKPNNQDVIEEEPLKVGSYEDKSISLSAEDEKREQTELRASFKASLKNSLSKAGSVISRNQDGDKNESALIRHSQMNDIVQRLDTAEGRIGNLEFTSSQTVQALGQTLNELKMRNEWLESQMPGAKEAEQLKQDIATKEEILKKKGNILNLLDLSKIEQDKASQSQLMRDRSPEIDAQINEMFQKAKQRHLPLQWDPLKKRWMGPDQIVVETAFNMPLEQFNHVNQPQTSSNAALRSFSGSNAKPQQAMQKRTRPKSSPGQSKHASLQAKNRELDARIKLRESQQFYEIVNQDYSGGKVGKARRKDHSNFDEESQDDDEVPKLMISANSISRLPRREIAMTQPQIFRRVMAMEDEELYRSGDQIAITQPLSRPGGGPAELNINSEQGSFMMGQKPKSATNFYASRQIGRKRNQSMQFNSGILTQARSPGEIENSASIANTHADKETNVDSSNKALAMRQEYRQVKSYAKTRLQQKHERKLFRPQTGVVSVAKKPREASNQDYATRNQLSSQNFGNVNTGGSASFVNLSQPPATNQKASSGQRPRLASSMNAFSPQNTHMRGGLYRNSSVGQTSSMVNTEAHGAI